jgi:uncharacterized membrane protein
MSHALSIERPVFGDATRWGLRVLAWTAFGVSAYLAWHAVGQTAVAGCEPGSGAGCDAVLNSPWAKWLGIPVAVVGLGCYAALAGLSVLLAIENSLVGRWIETAFLMLATVAAGASLWFLGIQILVIDQFCLYCLIADFCGIALGALSIWSFAQWFIDTRGHRRLQSSATGLMALRSALPVGTVGHAPAAAPRVTSAPSLPAAAGGAALLLVVLIAGQLLFPAKTHTLQAGTLDEPMALPGSNPATSNADAESSAGSSYVAMRISADAAANDARDTDRLSGIGDHGADSTPTPDTRHPTPDTDENKGNGGVSDVADDSDAIAPPRERFVEFLNGGLRLDVYKHPHIGSPEAPHVMIEMISYDCSHCRQMHRILKKGLARYRDQLAVIVMPIPLEMSCNKLVTSSAASHSGACTIARMALGVAAVRPELFPKFHDWLMADKEKPPPQSQVVTRAYNMVDSTQLSKRSRSPEMKEQIADYIDLYSRLQRRQQGGTLGLPVQILGDHILSGMAADESDVFDAWEKHLGVVRR